MEGIAPLDGWALAAIFAKACGYGAALLAIGGPIFVLALRPVSSDVLRVARHVTVAAAIVCLCVLALQFGIRSARLSGVGMAGMTDTIILSIVWESPLGWAAMCRAAGVSLVLFILLDRFGTPVIALFGSVLIGVSYTFVGHALGDPRPVLAAMLLIHLIAAGFWLAALAPLYWASDQAGGAVLLHRFGVVAGVTVPLLILAGLIFAWLMTGSVSALVTTAYGWTLLSKLVGVAALLSLAALNKWRLVPALAAGDKSAGLRLRRSIRWEAMAFAVILLATATLTSVTTPPVNL